MSEPTSVASALKRWQPRRDDTHGDPSPAIATVTRRIVAAAKPEKPTKATIAAGYVYRFLLWATQDGSEPTEDLITTARVEEYLTHLHNNADVPDGTLNAARSYLKRCASDGTGFPAVSRAGTPAREASVAGRIAEYEPDPDRISVERWHQVRSTVVEAVTATRPATVERASSLMTVTAIYVAWASEAGLDLFSCDSVEGFIKTGATTWTKATARTYASGLRAVARTVRPKDWPLRSELKRHNNHPYRPEELADIVQAIAGQPSGRRKRNLEAAYLLGIGAGVAGIEAANITPEDILDEDPIGVRVVGRRARTVTPGRSAGLRLLELAAEAAARDERYLLGGIGNRYERQRDLWRQLDAAGVSVKPARLRFTWLVRLVAQPVPMQAIIDQAGVTGTDLLIQALRWTDPYDRTRATAAIAEGLS